LRIMENRMPITIGRERIPTPQETAALLVVLLGGAARFG
jgi:hypothetical protein